MKGTQQPNAALSPIVRLREFDSVADQGPLKQWLNQPHVSLWWGDAGEALEEALVRDPSAHAIIEADSLPVGYICWEAPIVEELEAAGLGDLPEGLLDVDILLGEASVQGRGIAGKAGGLLLEHLRATNRAPYLGAATSALNERAIRLAERVGFELFREFDDPESGKCRYMIIAL